MLQNFRGKNLQGKSFKNQNLTNTDFSNSDIRGADFTGANLAGANFKNATAGLAPRQVWVVVIIAAALSGMSCGPASVGIDQTFSSLMERTAPSLSFIPTIIALLAIVLLSVTIVRQGIPKTLGYLAVSVVGLALLIAFFNALSSDLHPILLWMISFREDPLMAAFAGTSTEITPQLVVSLILPVLGSMTVVTIVCFAVTLAAVVAGKKLAGLVVVEAMAVSAIATYFTERNSSRSLKAKVLIQAGKIDNTDNKCYDFLGECVDGLPHPPVVIAIIIAAIILALALVGLGTYAASRVLAEDDRYTLIRQLAVAFTGIGGTSFRRTNLTNANFSYATLKNTDFTQSNISRTLWYKSSMLDWAIVGETILNNPKVRELLVTRNGREKSYEQANLWGANLSDADLYSANLRNADLTDATLESANLEQANLTQIQAIGADFSKAQMTGVCGLGSWNIDSTTNLEWADSQWIYLLEDCKPGTDDRERRPHNGEFAPGEFTKFFQEVTNTVDLIFRQGLDFTAFNQSFVQVQNEGTELELQAIEKKGDGVVVVKVSVPVDADKAKIHQELMQAYDEKLAALDAKYQAKFDRLEQQNADSLALVKKLTAKQPDRLAIITIENSGETRSLAVTVNMWPDDDPFPKNFQGELPPVAEVVALYREWQSQYNSQLPVRANRSQPAGNWSNSYRIKFNTNQATNFSIKSLIDSAEEFKISLNAWLKSDSFRIVEDKLRENFRTEDEVRIVIQTQNDLLWRIPWHCWNFFNDYEKAEVALSGPNSDRIVKTAARNQLRILAILGDSQGIDVYADKEIIKSLPTAEIVTLEQPTRAECDRYLGDERGWDILCFSGHSYSKADSSTGVIQINENEMLTIEELKDVLLSAIARNLHLAIFNSCDGLGLARQLADLHLPQTIVMREPLPDRAAQEFLKEFLSYYSNGKSLYVSVREARKKLQSLEENFPNASWLPVIWQNQAERPRNWGNTM